MQKVKGVWKYCSKQLQQIQTIGQLALSSLGVALWAEVETSGFLLILLQLKGK